MKCAICLDTMDLFERACAAIKALPPAKFAELKAALLAQAASDLKASERIQ